MLVVGAELKSTKNSMTFKAYRRRPRDVEYQDEGCHVKNSDL